jgi:CRISPR-associated protein Cmr2
LRPASPAYHAALSRAQNGFAVHLAPRVVERCFQGKLLYAGGDELLAMTSLRDLLEQVVLLRCAYSGKFDEEDPEAAWAVLRNAVGERPALARGFARLRSGSGERLKLLMGERASASVGVVVAHSMAPMQAVMRELWAAVRRAKELGGRDAFSITRMKRSGGTGSFTASFGLGEDRSLGPSPLGVLIRLQHLLEDHVSRQAAYQLSDWLLHVPSSGGELPAMLESMIGLQLRRHLRPGSRSPPELIGGLARDLARLACAGTAGEAREDPLGYVREAFHLAEFLARGAHSPVPETGRGEQQEVGSRA